MKELIMRKIERILQAHIAPVGTFTVRRALPDRARQSVGPFVFLDHFGPFAVTRGVDGVGPHPHAGIETVTYLLSGRNEHHDSAGHRGIVGPGGAQWMTSGRGVVHAEYPRPENDAEMTQHGIQLWTTLPRALKSIEPGYQRLDRDAIPAVVTAEATVRVIAGEFGNTKGPAEVLMPTLLWHITVNAQQTFTAAVPTSHEVGAYVFDGIGGFSPNAQRVGIGQLVVFENTGDTISFSNTGDTPLEVMLLGGAPAEGPLVFHGPFVMNSVEQVRAAEKAYHAGRMGELQELRN
jgi:quercetin 2,3-dioxygenase